ncbi:hypothetical protein [Enterobacter sp.]|uniref:hypothetical protein n=1 Tax=Enterobacter sp. TaxID=42895 RepID=UPI003A8DD312
MDAKKLCAAFAVFALSSSVCLAAGHSGKIRFIGQVVEGGCWNVTGTHNVTCQHNNATTHYQLTSNSQSTLDASNATVITRAVARDASLELMQITYH